MTEENVQILLPAANLLQLNDVRDACCEFLQRQLHPTNCLGIRRLVHLLLISTWKIVCIIKFWSADFLFNIFMDLVLPDKDSWRLVTKITPQSLWIIDILFLGCCTRFLCTLIKWYSQLVKIPIPIIHPLYTFSNSPKRLFY